MRGGVAAARRGEFARRSVTKPARWRTGYGFCGAGGVRTAIPEGQWSADYNSLIKKETTTAKEAFGAVALLADILGKEGQDGRVRKADCDRRADEHGGESIHVKSSLGQLVLLKVATHRDVTKTLFRNAQSRSCSIGVAILRSRSRGYGLTPRAVLVRIDEVGWRQRSGRCMRTAGIRRVARQCACSRDQSSTQRFASSTRGSPGLRPGIRAGRTTIAGPRWPRP